MAEAVIARQLGDDYHAQVFWLNACRLFQPQSNVIQVDYEADELPFFDDVVVRYNPSIQNEYQDIVKVDYYQVKFHVSQTKPFTWKELIASEFIRRESKTSLLQRLKRAQETLGKEGNACRFLWLAPKIIDPYDLLANLVDNNNGKLRLKILQRGGDRSQMGQIRKAWRNHLGFDSDQELFTCLRSLRILAFSPSFESSRMWLNDKLELAGFKPLKESSLINQYNDLIRKLHRDGVKHFTKERLQEICEREGLWIGDSKKTTRGFRLGIRSFRRPFGDIADETDTLLCLFKHFDGRHIKENSSWDKNILPELRSFLKENIELNKPTCILLDVHSTIAFACGYYLDTKSNVDLSVIQGPLNRGDAIWNRFADTGKYDSPLWSCNEIIHHSQGKDVSVAISVTADVVEDVKLYAQKYLPDSNRTLAFNIQPRPNHSAVKGALHAWKLVEGLVHEIRERRTIKERLGQLHFFISAPNAFMFFLGQVAKNLGRITLYEYDFESNLPGAYSPSFSFPIKDKKS